MAPRQAAPVASPSKPEPPPLPLSSIDLAKTTTTTFQQHFLEMPPPPERKQTQKQAAAKEAVDILQEISTILVSAQSVCIDEQLGLTASSTTNPQNCHLDRQTLSLCISMIENGVNPEALAVRLSLSGTHASPFTFAHAPADRPLSRSSVRKAKKLRFRWRPADSSLF